MAPAGGSDAGGHRQDVPDVRAQQRRVLLEQGADAHQLRACKKQGVSVFGLDAGPRATLNLWGKNSAGARDSTGEKALILLTADQGSTPGIILGPPSLPRVIPKHKARRKS